MKFVPIPKFPAGRLDDEQAMKAFREFREFLAIPGNLKMYPCKQVVSGNIFAEGSTIKPVRDDAAKWFPAMQTFEYFVLRGEVNLKLRLRPGDAGNPIVDAENLMDLSGFYSREAIEFYNRRFLKSNGAEFARIPRMVRVTVTNAEALRININTPDNVTPVGYEWPIAIPQADGHAFTTLPVKVAFRFNGDTVEAFNIDDYDHEIPVSTGNDDEIFDEITAIMAMPRSKAERVNAIRQVVKQ